MTLLMNLQNQFMPQSLGLNQENLGQNQEILGQNQEETLTLIFLQIVLIPMIAPVAGEEGYSMLLSFTGGRIFHEAFLGRGKNADM